MVTRMRISARMLEFTLGTPPGHKKRLVCETDIFLSKDAMAWLDRYLGSVNKALLRPILQG